MAKIICPNDALTSVEKSVAFRATRPHTELSARPAGKSRAVFPFMLILTKAAVSIRALWARIRFKMLF